MIVANRLVRAGRIEAAQRSLFLALLILPLPLSAAQLITFDPPGSTATLPAGMNSAGQITGYYHAGTNWSGFLRNSDGTFVSFDPPGSTFTQPTAINKHGVITGQWAVSNYNFQGFVRDPAGSIAVFNYPGSAATQPLAINGSGSIVGAYSLNSTLGSFLRDPNGTFVDIKAPSSTSTTAISINDGGQILGFYEAADFSGHAFIRDAAGSYVTFDAPGAGMGAYPKAINDAGTVTGYWFDSNYGGHGYVRDASGNITTFDAPKAAPGGGPTVNAGTFPVSINDFGEVTGWVAAQSNAILTFVRFPSGHITEIGANKTLNFHQPVAVQVTDRASIVGAFLQQGNAYDFHGFAATP